MIEGLHFDVAGEELKAHLLKRIAHHNEREAWYLSRIADLKAGGVEKANMSGGDPLQGLEVKAHEHHRKESTFQWMADHVDVTETYRVTEEELAKLEIIETKYRW